MNHSAFVRPEPSLSGESIPIDKATFSQLYNRYAPMLLGVITAIVRNDAEAARLLEVTFNEIRSQYSTARPTAQPLFVWLLSIVRSVALDAVKNQQTIPDPTNTGKVMMVVSVSANASTDTGTQGSSSANDLLNAVLFRNCTLEEAVSAVGLSAATARQQLRQAMQQLRTLGTL